MKATIHKLLDQIGYQIKKSDSRYKNDFSLYKNYFPEESLKKKPFYNLSAGGHFGFGGKFHHPLWRNIDILKAGDHLENYNPEKDIDHDFLSIGPLPLETGSAELLHTRYAIEHLTDEAADKMFKEVYRILKSDGIFKIVVPNFQLDYIAYIRKDKSYFNWIENFSKPEMMDLMKYSIPLNKASLQQIFLVHFASNASTIHSDGSENRIGDDELDEIIRNNSMEKAMTLCTSRCSLEKQRKYRQNHINWWSPCKLGKYLKQAGFKKVYQISPGQSISPVMRNPYYFDNLWNNVAFFMEAVK